jgi:hypothetical protein
VNNYGKKLIQIVIDVSIQLKNIVKIFMLKHKQKLIWISKLYYLISEFYYNPYNIYGKCYVLPITKFDGTTIPKSKLNFLDPFDREPGTVPSCSEA